MTENGQVAGVLLCRGIFMQLTNKKKQKQKQKKNIGRQMVQKVAQMAINRQIWQHCLFETEQRFYGLDLASEIFQLVPSLMRGSTC